MDCRIMDSIKRGNDRLHYLEVSPAVIDRLRERGVNVSPQAEALPGARHTTNRA